MKYPDREPFVRESLRQYQTAMDWEDVIQPDGARARFKFCNGEAEKGWQFFHIIDDDDFILDPSPDERRRVLENEAPIARVEDRSERLPKVANDETLHAWHFGGPMSERAGFYVTPIDDPTRVLRYKGTWMS